MINMHVCKIGGAQCANPETLDALSRSWRNRSDDATWIIVHGAGPQLNIALQQAVGEPRRVQGLRVTPPAAADVVRKQMDLVGAELAAGLRARGIPTRHVSASDKRLKAVPKSAPNGEDLGRVGTATQFDRSDLDTGAEVLVVTPVGWDAEGPLNVNADEGALAVAQAFDTKRLVLLTDVEGVLCSQGHPIAALTPRSARELVAAGVAKGGMIPKIENALEALQSGIPEVRIGDVEALVEGGTAILEPIEVTVR